LFSDRNNRKKKRKNRFRPIWWKVYTFSGKRKIQKRKKRFKPNGLVGKLPMEVEG
jgi:hypothetical protein